MEYTFQALLVQKNASRLINELLFTLTEVPFDTADLKMTGDGISTLTRDPEIWDVTKWSDEETMNEYKAKITDLRDLISEIKKDNAFRGETVETLKKIQMIFQDPISEWLCKSLKIDMDGRPCTPWAPDLLWYSLS